MFSKDEFFKWLYGKEKGDFLENLSIVIMVLSAVFTVFGISVGTFVPGIPVLIAILGAFLILVGIALYIFSEFYRLLTKD